MTAVSKNLYGLILAGGRSKRMGKDKALLAYGNKSQLERAHNLLALFCAKVFVSIRTDQGQKSEYERLSQIHDLPQFSDMGPLGGILSAMAAYPDAAWLVLACDLPFVTTEAIRYLMEHRDMQKAATAFISTHDRLPEPLCAVWEPNSYQGVMKLLDQGIQCPRKALIKSDTHLIEQKDPRWLDNVNSPEEYEQAVKTMSAD